jgi:glutathione S-transferase
MALTLYYHPLASFCWKALIALYEYETPFTPHLVDLGNETSRSDFLKVWPMGQFPVLREAESGKVIPQSSVIIEYLTLRHAGPKTLIPKDPDHALEVRRWDGFYDTYVHVPMQKIVGDTLRPEGETDRTGVRDARKTLRTAYDVLENRMQEQSWAAGDTFTMADCAAAPALFYADKVAAFDASHPQLANYFERLKQRPSFARVLEEAGPYFHMFPYKGER